LVENVYPELRMKDYFNIQKVQNALKVDALESTRPMLFNAETPSGISGLYDRIAYDKCKSITFK
jgi:aminopeptidase N